MPSPATPLFLNTYKRIFGGWETIANGLSSPSCGSINWPAANRAYYVPFSLPYEYPVRRLFWANGATGGGNADIGVYTENGEAIYRQGSTAQSGTSNLQYVTPATAILLDRGRYYLAVWFSGTTGVAFGWIPGSGSAVRFGGLLAQSSLTTGLPATATFANAGSGALPLAGITKTATGY